VKRTVRSNFRVQVSGTVTLSAVPGSHEIRLPVTGEIPPRRLGDFGWMSMSDSMASRNIQADYEQRCREIVDALTEQQPRLKAEIVCDTREECSHCGLEWEEFTQADADRHPDWDDPVGMPQCCETAQDEFLEAAR
jgi:hypothetical protein